MEPNAINFVLVGVGGQGTILASDVLAELGLKLGYDVKKAEIHGMSQRGGSVISHVRWAEQVFSPIISKGQADVLVAFEKLESVRFLDLLKPCGIILVNDYSIEPVTVTSGTSTYPEDAVINETLEKVTAHVHWVKGVELAEGLGNARAANVVLLGALAGLLNLDTSAMDEILKLRVPPKYLALNQKAFQAGWQAVQP